MNILDSICNREYVVRYVRVQDGRKYNAILFRPGWFVFRRSPVNRRYYVQNVYSEWPFKRYQR